MKNNTRDTHRSPVFGLRYLEDREVDGIDVVGCMINNGNTGYQTATGCDDSDTGRDLGQVP